MDKPAPELTQEARAPRTDPGSWWSESMCRQYPTQWWFAGGQRDTQLAKGICSGCAVQGSCLEFALGRPELLGVWAATTPNERAALRRAARGGTANGFPIAAPEARDVETDADLDARSDLERVLHAEPPAAPASEPELELRLDAGPEPDAVPGDGGRPELLTPAEAAHLLGVTPNTVTRWSRAGKVSAIQTMGGHRRFRRAEVERVLREANLRS